VAFENAFENLFIYIKIPHPIVEGVRAQGRRKLVLNKIGRERNERSRARMLLGNISSLQCRGLRRKSRCTSSRKVAVYLESTAKDRRNENL
jgi:hypothetical protein